MTLSIRIHRREFVKTPTQIPNHQGCPRLKPLNLLPKSLCDGDVKQVGYQSISNVPLTLLYALNQAGGLLDNADWRRAVLIRQGQEAPSPSRR